MAYFNYEVRIWCLSKRIHMYKFRNFLILQIGSKNTKTSNVQGNIFILFKFNIDKDF